jgi:hypothetical protein
MQFNPHQIQINFELLDVLFGDINSKPTDFASLNLDKQSERREN